MYQQQKNSSAIYPHHHDIRSCTHVAKYEASIMTRSVVLKFEKKRLIEDRDWLYSSIQTLYVSYQNKLSIISTV